MGPPVQFVATTLAIAWLVVFGVVLAAGAVPRGLEADLAPDHAEQAVGQAN